MDDGNWTRARLIPVSGIGSEKEAETRAASAVLAVLSVVRDLSSALFTPMGASKAAKASVDTFIEPLFNFDGKKIRPDGLVRVSFGQSIWTAVVEFKTGSAVLEPDQINAYWDLAREHNFDAVITISNQIAPSPGTHPTEGLRVRSNSKVQVHHISWTALLSTAVMIKAHKGVADPEQAWLLGELIRYLEHSASGALAFDDMGTNWVTVRDGARDDTLRKTDPEVADIASRWDQLMRYSALQLGSQIGSDVLHVLPRTEQDQRTRLQKLSERLADQNRLTGVLRVPNTVSDISIVADLKARRITAAITVAAPEDRGARGRCSWLVGQLKAAPDDLSIEAFPKNARTPTIATLSDASDQRDALLTDDRREPTKFNLVLTREMGLARKSQARSPGFIDSITALIEQFYGLVVQSIIPWTPKAPKITAPPGLAASVDDSTESEFDSADGGLFWPPPTTASDDHPF